MPTATLSGKYQITIPMKIVRSLGLKPGDKLAIEQIEDRIVMLKEPASWADYFTGSLKGVYGETVEEIDRYIREVRYGHIHSEWREEFEDLLEKDDGIRQVVEALRTFPTLAATANELRKKVPQDSEFRKDRLGRPSNKVDVALEALVNHGSVRKIPIENEKGKRVDAKYRLVRDFANRS